MSQISCAYCNEPFGSTSAYDRHLLVRRQTVTTKKGHVVQNEEVVTCRPVVDFSKPMRNGEPRLVWSEGKAKWVTSLRPADTLPQNPSTRFTCEPEAPENLFGYQDSGDAA